MFTALAEGFGDLSNKVNLYIAMAPVLYLGYSSDSFFKELSGVLKLVKEALDEREIYELFGPKWQSDSATFCWFFKSICDENSITKTPITPYVDALNTNVVNLRSKSSASVK